MSIDLSLILPNECHDIRDNALALRVFNEAIDRVTQYFGGREGFVDQIVIFNSDSPDWEEPDPLDEDPDEPEVEYSFDIPLIAATCHLNQGYWDIWPMARYAAYFYAYALDTNGHVRLWPREYAFSIARCFGFSEGWICDEYHSWNSHLYLTENASFEQWCAYGECEEDTKVYEFDLGVFGGKLGKLTDYRSKYHDHFAECYALVDTIEQRYQDYKILALGQPTPHWALATKDGQLYVININTGLSLTPFPIDCCRANFMGNGFSITKDGKTAFFNKEGKQVTEFRKGGFKWKWVDALYVQIIDEATGQMFSPNAPVSEDCKL